MNPRKNAIAPLQAVLILPATFFMVALLVRYLQLPQHHLSDTARQIVMWYAARMWTLWLFLLALPSAALAVGTYTLISRSNDRALFLPTKAIALETLISAGILAIVVLHMLAN